MDTELFPLEVDVHDESEGCFELYSDNKCSAVDDTCSDWTYAGGTALVVQIEETSTAAIEKSRTFGCDLPEVWVDFHV